MRTLLEYLQNKIDNSVFEGESQESKTFTFDFSGIDNGKDIIKSLTDMEGVSIDGDKVKVTISKDSNTDSAEELLTQTIEGLRKSSKSINIEEYAQKTKKLQVTLSELNDFKDILENPEEEEEESKNKKEEKSKKKKEEE